MRRRYRKNRNDERRQKHDHGSGTAEVEEMQRTILLKAATALPTSPSISTSASASASTSLMASTSPTGFSPQQSSGYMIVLPPIKPTTTTPSEAHTAITQPAKAVTMQILDTQPQMIKPITLIQSTDPVNGIVKKYLSKNNTDFFVVGIIGTQNVGKSTLMNILANEDTNYDYYQKIFKDESNLFPTKLKTNKSYSRSVTEAVQIFITKERLILLDTPPVLANSYQRDNTNNELDDLRNIITLLTTCHLLIVVQDDYFNIGLMRLLQFAEIMKPSQQDTKSYVQDYFPHLLFVKNRAKRLDYTPGQKTRMDKILKNIFKDSQMSIYHGQTVDDQTLPTTSTLTTTTTTTATTSPSSSSSRQRKQQPLKLPPIGVEHKINSFYFPEICKDDNMTCHQNSLGKTIEEFRQMVAMTPRVEMYTEPNQMTESVWFDMLTRVAQDTQQFFYNTYVEVHNRKRLEMNINNGQDQQKDIL